MSPFRTIYPPFKADFEINYQNQILSIGSCFAEHISNRLTNLKFQTLLNPFGIVYNPTSVFQTLDWLGTDILFTESDLFQNQGLWHSFYHHGQFSKVDKLETLTNVNHSLEQGREFLKNTDRLILTFGTAHVFEFRETKKVVANCHKLPAQNFIRRRMSIAEVYENLIQIHHLTQRINPEIKVILTVSPVRHIRDGLVENQKSKATLLLAIDQFIQKYPDSNLYFPSYEMILDDLRDYRFFKDDLIHPTDMAIQYVWEYFEKALFNEETSTLKTKIQKIKTAIAHRPLHIESEPHQAFLKKQLLKIEGMEREYPFLNFEKERKILEVQKVGF